MSVHKTSSLFIASRFTLQEKSVVERTWIIDEAVQMVLGIIGICGKEVYLRFEAK